MPYNNFYYATCHKMEVNTSKNNNLKSKNPHSATCQVLMDGSKLVLSTLCYCYSCNELYYIYVAILPTHVSCLITFTT
jgi:hypothetical protein